MRRYGTWVGNRKGNAEDKTRCIVSVIPNSGWPISHQCNNKRKHGEYCTLHYKQLQAGRHPNIPKDETEE